MGYLITWKDKEGVEHDTPVFSEGTLEDNITFFKKYHNRICTGIVHTEKIGCAEALNNLKSDLKEVDDTLKSIREVTVYNSPNAYSRHLLKKRKFTDQYIYERVVEKFPNSKFKLQYVGIKRSDLNRGEFSEEPIQKIN